MAFYANWMKSLTKLTLAGLVLWSGLAAASDQLFDAIRVDDAPAARQIISRSPSSLQSLNQHGQTPVHMAIIQEAPKVLKLLLAQPSTDVNKPNSQGDTPLMVASSLGATAFVGLLLDHGATHSHQGQWNALHYAAAVGHVDVLIVLLRAGADKNALSPNGTTPLMMAARQGKTDAVKYLLQAGADPSPKNEAGFNAAGYAMRAGQRDVAMDIMKKEKALRDLKDRKAKPVQ